MAWAAPGVLWYSLLRCSKQPLLPAARVEVPAWALLLPPLGELLPLPLSWLLQVSGRLLLAPSAPVLLLLQQPARRKQPP